MTNTHAMTDQEDQYINQTIHELERLIEHFEGKNDKAMYFHREMILRRAMQLKADLKHYSEVNS